MSAVEVVETVEPAVLETGEPQSREPMADPSSKQTVIEPPKRKWTREEYYKAAEAGIFKEDERLELIRGEVYQKVSPRNRPHVLSVMLSSRVLSETFGTDYHVQQESPVVVSGEADTEPEPDLAVVSGSIMDYQSDHPLTDQIVLIMEVSDSTYRTDSRFKASFYASVGIPDYWVLNLNKRELEVRREPLPDPKARFGASYGETHVYKEGESVSPLSAPVKGVAVRDLLPPQ